MSSAASSVSSMKKWGIPSEMKQPPEITLSERLVWVRYQSRWWPGILYHSYSELQHHLFDQLNMTMKAQFALAIMRQLQDKRKVKLARLLGRSQLEIIELEKGRYCEFYWHLSDVLPKASDISGYGEDIELYLDFHRAMDQVEDMFRETAQDKFVLKSQQAQQESWLDRALQNLEEEKTSICSGQRSSNKDNCSPLLKNSSPQSLSLDGCSVVSQLTKNSSGQSQKLDVSPPMLQFVTANSEESSKVECALGVPRSSQSSQRQSSKQDDLTHVSRSSKTSSRRSSTKGEPLLGFRQSLRTDDFSLVTGISKSNYTRSSKTTESSQITGMSKSNSTRSSKTDESSSQVTGPSKSDSRRPSKTGDLSKASPRSSKVRRTPEQVPTRSKKSEQSLSSQNSVSTPKYKAQVLRADTDLAGNLSSGKSEVDESRDPPSESARSKLADSLHAMLLSPGGKHITDLDDLDLIHLLSQHVRS